MKEYDESDWEVFNDWNEADDDKFIDSLDDIRKAPEKSMKDALRQNLLKLEAAEDNYNPFKPYYEGEKRDEIYSQEYLDKHPELKGTWVGPRYIDTFNKTLGQKDLLKRPLTDQDYMRKVPLKSGSSTVDKAIDSLIFQLPLGDAIKLERFLKPENAKKIRDAMKDMYLKHPELLEQDPEDLVFNGPLYARLENGEVKPEYKEDIDKLRKLIKDNIKFETDYNKGEFAYQKRPVTNEKNDKGDNGRFFDQNVVSSNENLTKAVSKYFDQIKGKADTDNDGKVTPNEYKKADEANDTVLDYDVEPKSVEQSDVKADQMANAIKDVLQEPETVKPATASSFFGTSPTSGIDDKNTEQALDWSDPSALKVKADEVPTETMAEADTNNNGMVEPEEVVQQELQEDGQVTPDENKDTVLDTLEDLPTEPLPYYQTGLEDPREAERPIGQIDPQAEVFNPTNEVDERPIDISGLTGRPSILDYNVPDLDKATVRGGSNMFIDGNADTTTNNSTYDSIEPNDPSYAPIGPDDPTVVDPDSQYDDDEVYVNDEDIPPEPNHKYDNLETSISQEEMDEYNKENGLDEEERQPRTYPEGQDKVPGSSRSRDELDDEQNKLIDEIYKYFKPLENERSVYTKDGQKILSKGTYYNDKTQEIFDPETLQKIKINWKPATSEDEKPEDNKKPKTKKVIRPNIHDSGTTGFSLFDIIARGI